MHAFRIPDQDIGQRKKTVLLQAENERLKNELAEAKEREMMFAKVCLTLLMNYTR